jgi:hypothetical protein
VKEKTYCSHCGAELDLGQEFIYQVESMQFVDDPILLELIRRLPDYHGEPLRLCKECRDSIAASQIEIADAEREAERIQKRARWMCLATLLLVLAAAATSFVTWLTK